MDTTRLPGLARLESTTSPGLSRYRLAHRAANFHHSPWAVPADLIGRHPAPISLSSGAPSEDLVPVRRLAEAASRVWANSNSWGYAGAAGLDPLREWLGQWLSERSVIASRDEIVITTGSQQGIDLVARVFLNPGDTVIVEGPTYIGALQVFDSYGATYFVAPMDDHGLDTDALEAMLADRAAQDQPSPRLLYTVPTFQNPTGRLMSDDRRDALVRLARRHGIVIVEDDPYGELYFHDAPPRSLRARDGDVIALGTFSKTLAPALRTGWMVVPPDLVDLMVNAREVNDVHGDLMSQRIVASAVSGFLDDHVAWLRTQYRRRCDHLDAALRDGLPEQVRIERPGGGFFIWLDLPDGIDSARLMASAADNGVLFLPGGWFYPDRRPDPGLRLSFSRVSEDLMTEAARRLTTAITASLAVGVADR